MSTLLRGFVDAVDCHAERVALCIADRRWTYRQLGADASRIASAIAESELSNRPLVGLLASESGCGYAGIPAILAAGKGVVPMEPTHPPATLYQIAEHAGLDTLVVGDEAVDRLEALLSKIGRPMAIIAPDTDERRGLTQRFSRCRFWFRNDVTKGVLPPAAPIAEDRTAFLLYTAAFCTHPKAVAISHRTAGEYVDELRRRFPVAPGDRCSQTFPLSFDWGIGELFSTWASGASAVVWPKRHRGDAARFIRRHRLTRWSSVPTRAVAMQRLGQLKGERFPSLKTTLFCGEPLSAHTAHRWREAAPNSEIAGLYGPPEAFGAVAVHSLHKAHHPGGDRPLVCVGSAVGDHQLVVVDGDGPHDTTRRRGELVVAGPRVLDGYWHNPEATRRRFVELPQHPGKRFVRTGDVVERDETGRLHFEGRRHDRIRLRGHRIELSEIDRVLQRVSGRRMAVAVGWPRDHTGACGLVGLIGSDTPVDTREILAGCRRRLPGVMVPDRIVDVPELPTDDRSELDRALLTQLLEHREV